MTEAQYYKTIYIVDDNEAFRDSLIFLLESVGWPVLAYASAKDFLAACPYPLAAPENLGCLILDIRMPGMSGLELQQTLNTAGWVPAVIFMTGHGDVELAVQAMKQGAFDFMEKPFHDQKFIDAVAAAVRYGEAQQVGAERREYARSLLQRLSPREMEVAHLVAMGLPNKQVARDLDISEKTVHVHRHSIMEKTNLGSAAELARLMLQADPKSLG